MCKCSMKISEADAHHSSCSHLYHRQRPDSGGATEDQKFQEIRAEDQELHPHSEGQAQMQLQAKPFLQERYQEQCRPCVLRSRSRCAPCTQRPRENKVNEPGRSPCSHQHHRQSPETGGATTTGARRQPRHASGACKLGAVMGPRHKLSSAQTLSQAAASSTGAAGAWPRIQHDASRGHGSREVVGRDADAQGLRALCTQRPD